MSGAHIRHDRAARLTTKPVRDAGFVLLRGSVVGRHEGPELLLP